MNFGIDTTITKEELEKEDMNVLANRLYYEAKDHYNQKNELMNQQTLAGD